MQLSLIATCMCLQLLYHAQLAELLAALLVQVYFERAPRGACASAARPPQLVCQIIFLPLMLQTITQSVKGPLNSFCRLVFLPVLLHVVVV